MFAFEPEFAVAVMDKKEVGLLPAPKRMTFYTISRTCVFVRIIMAIGAGLRGQAYVLCALMQPAGTTLKMALLT
jgi:hypothetical protein